ncbi:hypothetical protein [Streptomyces sp. NPDC059378]|uniref:hypothetical protein n=1 Tax=Streptomyces sp. NPDC059378 TaxID=3346815 RepID=UPI0036795D4E
MTAAPERSSRLLLLSTVILAVAAVALLGGLHGHVFPDPTSGPASGSAGLTTTHAPSAAAVSAAGTGPSAVSTRSSAAPTSSAPPGVQSVLPPHGEGAAGDRFIQRNLEAAWPADLSAVDERVLLGAGRALLRADATGVGRTAWPEVFPDAGQAVAPAFATAGFRIQAAIARRGPAPGTAVVHLVWAGIDRGGTFTDLRVTDWHFTRTSAKKGAATWTAQPRT